MVSLKQLFGFKPHTFMWVAVVHMKSGKTLLVPCDDASTSMNTTTGELTRYQFTNAMMGCSYYINISEIEAVTLQKFNRFKNYLKQF